MNFIGVFMRGNRFLLFVFLIHLLPAAYALDVDDIVVIPRVILDTSGFSGDLAVDPSSGALHCIWSNSDFELKHTARSFDGLWSETETIPTLGLPVYADEGEGGYTQWARVCCGIDIDEQGTVHIVYGVDDGDIYYVHGHTGQWSDPERIVEQDFHACHPEIEVSDGNIYIIWENAEESYYKEIFQINRIHGTWSEPRFVMYADNPDLYLSDFGILYIIGRLHNYEMDLGLDHHVMFGYSVPGFTDWQIKQVTHSSPYRVGKAPRLAIYNGQIYMAWSISVGNLATVPDKKGRLYCAYSYEPGTYWDVTYSENTDPIYTVATGDPYGCVGVYSDGTVFYANGKAGATAVNADQSFKIWLGKRWSGLRPAEWEDGIAHLASDGKTIWAIGSSSGYSDREVSVSGYINPNSDPFDFADHAPQFVTLPDTIALSHSLWQTSCQATDPDGDPVKYSLRFAMQGAVIDTSTGSIQWQTGEAGTHVMGVKADDNRGKCDTHYFRLHVVDQYFWVDFTAEPVQGVEPLTVQFANHSQGPIEQYMWDFGDGHTSTLENPVHVYAIPGVYPVQLKVIGSVGSDSLIQENMITVDPEPVTARFSASKRTGTAPLQVQFSDSSTGAVHSWLWDFGDGETSTDQHPSHVYQAPDTYSVSLTVTGPYGEDIRFRSDFIRVQHTPPVADFTAEPKIGLVPLTVRFQDLSAGLVQSRTWDFGDGHTSTQQHPSHTYTSSGDYNVQLIVTGPGGDDTKTIEKYIHVGAIVPPEAAFSGEPLTGYAPLAVQFHNESTGSNLVYQWYFGDFSVQDGGYSEEEHPIYTYSQPGNYSVLLTLIGPDSTDTELKHNYIQVLEPSGVEADPVIPQAYAIYHNSPNPFNMTTRIRYDIPETGQVHISVFDARGLQIRSLLQTVQEPGQHQILWDGCDMTGQSVPSGLYFVRLITDSFTGHIKVMLIK